MKPRRPRLPKLRTRVLVGVLGVTLVALVAFDIAVVTALRSYLTGQTDSQLQSVLNVYRMLPQYRSSFGVPLHGGTIKFRPPPQVPRQRAQRPARWTRTVHGPPVEQRAAGPFLQPFSFELVSGRTVRPVSPVLSFRGFSFGTNPGLVPRLPIPAHLTGLASSGQGMTVLSRGGSKPLRLMAMPLPPPPERNILVATTSLDGVNSTVGQVELILVTGSAAAGLLAAGGAFWVMRRGLRPIETMAAQADAINAGDLASRVPAHDPQTELGRLATAINGMLARVGDFIAEREASQEATRRFFADASHELRTPLASLRANAELYQQGALTERPQVDEAMRRITLEAQRMSALVDDMLRLARLDQHPERLQEPVDLTGLVTECAERVRIANPQRVWRAGIAPDLMTNGDEELLRRALDNILANVLTHTPACTAATITAARYDGSVTVEVSDEGPGVPADRLPRIFERFYRAEVPSPRPGSGLGLAVVAGVAAAHDGTVEAASNDPHGLRITLTLPTHNS
ncbi:MAG TPA: HAMP domain-containing sensor histidine kinase [Streptosporangiaceae bacterium]|nr:HAMP domain-containing sensor histidine kinase [Streptosporangiaceae bacterium]